MEATNFGVTQREVSMISSGRLQTIRTGVKYCKTACKRQIRVARIKDRKRTNTLLQEAFIRPNLARYKTWYD